MRKAYSFFCLSFLLVFSAYAQADLYLGAELNGGLMGKAGLQNGLLDKKNYSPNFGGQLSASLRFFDRIGLEAGIGQHWSRIRLRDGAFEDEIDGFSLDLKNTSLYWNTYFAASLYFPLGRTDSYLYGKFGISTNFYEEGSVSKSSSVQVSNQRIDRDLEYTANYQASNVSFQPEIGVQHKFYGGNLLSLGFRYNIGQSDFLESEYTITDNTTGAPQSDRLSSAGDAFLINLRFDFRIAHYSAKEKVRRRRSAVEDYAIDVSNKPTKPSDTTPPTNLGNRDLNVTDQVKVHAEQVLIKVWDRQTVDGDRISLNLNGEWILENYTLKKEKLELKVNLKEGLNIFVLHALNLGKIRPNTAAFTVDDGEKEHKVVLESNMKESGTLRIIYKKKDNNE